APAPAPAHGHGESKGIYGAIERAYVKILAWSLARRWVIVLSCVLSLVSIPVLFGLANANFLPDEDESQFQVTMRAPEGTSLDATRLIANRIGAQVEKVPGVRYTVTTIGDDPQKTPNLALIYVKLLAPKDRKPRLSQIELIQKVRAEVLPAFVAKE